MKSEIKLVIHGGAGKKSLDPARIRQRKKSIQFILRSGLSLLEDGASAVDVVTQVVQMLEDDPQFNAGKGSKIQKDGKIRMSASVMDGFRLRFAGCINVEGLKNPIQLAKRLLSEKDRVLAGKGASQFARSKKLEFANPFTQEARAKFLKQKSGKTGTVGAVAMDSKGRLAAATSTGGRGYEYPERVSDSATVAGNYANKRCAFSATGIGEEIVEASVCARAAAFIEVGIKIKDASKKILKDASKRGFQFGYIGLSKSGDVVADHTTPSMCWGYISPSKIKIYP
jgi:L-asparaginase